MFIHEGVPIKKNLSAAIRQRLVVDTFDRLDKKTGRINVYRRVSYYDSKKQFNVSVGSKKLGERDPNTGLIVDILRRKSPQRAAFADALQELAEKAQNKLSDDRQEAKIVYDLPVILDTALLSALGGQTGAKGLALYWKTNRAALKERWGRLLPKTCPTTATTHRLLRIINPDELQKVYEEYVFPLLPVPNQRGVDKSLVHVDGQAIRASRTTEGRQHQMLSFYSTEAGIAFCQIRIEDKSNEKPAALKLAQRLDLVGTIVTGDAMHCDRQLLETLMRQSRADYCMALKMNQEKTANEVKALFDAHPEAIHETTRDHGHGRNEVRTTYMLPGNMLSAEVQKKWFGIPYGCLVKQVTERTVIGTHGKEDETSVQTRYFLSSLSSEDPDVLRHLQRAVRGHWGIENKLHHVLDVDFGQDAMQAKNNNYIFNVTQITKLALAIIELVRRRGIKEGSMSRYTTINELKLMLQNNPKLAGEYLDTFIRESLASAASRPEEPLTK